jgi:hypothetical protein
MFLISPKTTMAYFFRQFFPILKEESLIYIISKKKWMKKQLKSLDEVLLSGPHSFVLQLKLG